MKPFYDLFFLKRNFLLAILCLLPLAVMAQNSDSIVKSRLNIYFNAYPTHTTGHSKLSDLKIDYSSRTIDIYANDGFSEQPFRTQTVDSIYSAIKLLLPGPVNYFKITVHADGTSIDELIPTYYRKKKKNPDRLLTDLDYKGEPWVRCLSDPKEITRGLQDRHLMVGQSHGKYYSEDQKNWLWQRPRLFCTTEDLYTQSFVLPYIIPMLQNAGAIVYTPRERDTQTNEVIVDNDTNNGHSIYFEHNSNKNQWIKPDSITGFAQTKKNYQDGENPFKDGSVRVIATERHKEQAFAEWIPDIPETGKYAVYISYRSLSGSVTDAKYEVFHKGGVTQFLVNQQMGSGTWVYLGTFFFEKGVNDYDMVVLSNESHEKGIICADAVRFGGGMGNIERNGKTSGLPRYLEGARYSTQWAGFPYTVYGGYKGKDDYKDDINCRSLAVNYLSGGSIFNPRQKGLNVPIELSLALHSDAGYSKKDQFIGSLGIYTTAQNEGRLNSGISRYASRDFTDLLLSQIQKDVDTQFKIDWPCRGMRDKNYSESRLPSPASCIIEIMAHQNFQDMIYGHDPVFKFTVGRAVYKAILRYEAIQHGTDYVVAPLPIRNFAIQFGKKKNTCVLSWIGTQDYEEPTSTPLKYKVYSRIGNSGFDNGTIVDRQEMTIKMKPGLVYSFKVAALNHGGESFLSEILSAYKTKQERRRILIVNGFNRLSGPAVFATPTQAGFDLKKDPGVPYQQDITLCGAQQEFNRSNSESPTIHEWGYSGNELEGKILIGNNFDYPIIDGEAIQAAGSYSFVSASREAFVSNTLSLKKINIIDLILGLQKEDSLTISLRGMHYKTIDAEMQNILRSFCKKKNNALFISGSYIGSDMNYLEQDKTFVRDVLHIIPAGSAREIKSGKIIGLNSTFSIPREINPNSYPVVAPDCLEPAKDAVTAIRYVDGEKSAAVACKGRYSTFVMGFPFESIPSATDRANIMAKILFFFDK